MASQNSSALNVVIADYRNEAIAVDLQHYDPKFVAFLCGTLSLMDCLVVAN